MKKDFQGPGIVHAASCHGLLGHLTTGTVLKSLKPVVIHKLIGSLQYPGESRVSMISNVGHRYRSKKNVKWEYRMEKNICGTSCLSFFATLYHPSHMIMQVLDIAQENREKYHTMLSYDKRSDLKNHLGL